MYTFRVPKNNAEFHVTAEMPCTVRMVVRWD